MPNPLSSNPTRVDEAIRAHLIISGNGIGDGTPADAASVTRVVAGNGVTASVDGTTATLASVPSTPSYSALFDAYRFLAIDYSVTGFGNDPEGHAWRTAFQVNAVSHDYGPRILIRGDCLFAASGLHNQVAISHHGSASGFGERTTVLDMATRTTVSYTTIADNGQGIGLAFAAGYFCQAYTAAGSTIKIKWLNAVTYDASYTTLGTVGTGWAMGMAAGNGLIAVACTGGGSNRIVYLDPTTRELAAGTQFTNVGSQIVGIAYGDNYFACAFDTAGYVYVAIINATTRALVTTINVGGPQYGITYSNGRFFVAMQTAAIKVISTATLTVTDTLSIGSASRAIAASSAGCVMTIDYSYGNARTINSETLSISQSYTNCPQSLYSLTAIG